MAGQQQGTSDQGYTGLVNKDGTLDHMNAMIQCLYHTQPLRPFFLSRRFEDALKENDERASEEEERPYQVLNRAAFHIGVLICLMWSSKFSSLRLTSFIDCLRGIEDMRGHVQIRQDASMFLKGLLEEMDTDLRRMDVDFVIKAPETTPDVLLDADLRKKAKDLNDKWLAEQDNGTSIIRDLFIRQIVIEWECNSESCDRGEVILEYYEDYIAYLDVLEPVGRENFIAWFKQEFCGPHASAECNGPGCTGEMQRYYYVWRVPPILVIQLGRRQIDEESSEDQEEGEEVELAKNTIPVELPDEINLSEYIHDYIENKKADYEIYAVVHHKGEKTTSGHYTAFAKYGQKWRKYDDNIVTEVTEEEAVCSVEAQTDIYAAFYRLKGPEPGKKRERESSKSPIKKRKLQDTEQESEPMT